LDVEVPKFKEDSTLISFLYPAQNKSLVDKLAERKINAFGRSYTHTHNIKQIFAAFDAQIFVLDTLCI